MTGRIDPRKVRLRYKLDDQGLNYTRQTATWHDHEADAELTVCICTNNFFQGLFWQDCGGAMHQRYGTSQFELPASDRTLKRWLRNAWLRRFADGETAGFCTHDFGGEKLAYVKSAACFDARQA